MQLKDEIALLEQHRRTTQLVIANLAATSNALAALPDDPRRERLLFYQVQMADIAQQSLNYTESMLTHLRSIEALAVGAA